MSKPQLALNPKHPERICWGCDKYCSAHELGCGNGTIRSQHPVELFGENWLKWELNGETSATATMVRTMWATPPSIAWPLLELIQAVLFAPDIAREALHCCLDHGRERLAPGWDCENLTSRLKRVYLSADDRS